MSLKFSLIVLAALICQAYSTGSSLGFFSRPCYVRSIRYGSYSPRSRFTYFGKSVTYKCNSGYKLSGNAVVKCGAFGLFAKVPTCVKIRGCSAPPKSLFPAYMTYSPSKSRYNTYEKLWLSCAKGYTLKVRNSNDESIRCLPSGSWETVKASCVPLFCPNPEKPENGKVKGNAPFTPKEKVWFSCNAGFILRGRKDLVCGDNGKWNDDFPTCQPIPKCDSLGDLENGSQDLDKSRYDVGDEITYECDDGFDLVGEAVITCLKSGEFDNNKPDCVAQLCPIPESPENGFFDDEQDEYPVTTQITFGCNEGYELIGSSQLVCEVGGIWSDEFPFCQEIFCDAINIDDGSFEPDQDQFVVGEDVTYTCDDGFKLEGEKTLVCQADGQFDEAAPECVPIQCEFPGGIDNGSTDSDDDLYNIGATVTYSCDDGFLLQGEEELTCQDDGEFTPDRPSCEPICPKPSDPKNGYIKGKRSVYRPNDKIWFICNTGFAPSGKKDLTCLKNGHWNGKFPTCVPSGCPKPSDPANGYIKGKRPTYKAGNKIWFICNTGFTPSGKKDLTCLGNGHWNGKFPTCVPVCQKPSDPKNGYIKGKRSVYKPGNKIWFICQTGFAPSGKKDLTCSQTGWNGNFPTCDAVSVSGCKAPPTVSRASYTPRHSQYSLGTKVTYKCYRNYVMVGDDDITCGKGGKWAPSGQKCVYTYSCADRCYKYVKGARCQCDINCKRHGNCCRNFYSRCH